MKAKRCEKPCWVGAERAELGQGRGTRAVPTWPLQATRSPRSPRVTCSAQCWRRVPLGPERLPLSSIRHCENIPLSVHFFIPPLFVCLLIILSLEQNRQWVRRRSICEELRVPAPPQSWEAEPGLWAREGSRRSRSHRHGLWSCLDVRGPQT